jgi:hypothetical protein
LGCLVLLAFELFVVSPPADRIDLGSTLGSVPVPLLLLEPTVVAVHGLGEQRVSIGDDATAVTRPHPMAHGTCGTVTACAPTFELLGSSGSGRYGRGNGFRMRGRRRDDRVRGRAPR